MPENMRMALFVAGMLILAPLAALAALRAATWALVNLLALFTMRRGVRYTGRRWQIVRNYALDRDGHRCRQCRRSYRQMDVHHCTPLSRLGSNQTWNLETLCRACHKSRHPHMRK